MYVIVWEFIARKDCKEQFESAYGEKGDWVAFFKKGDGYLHTNLLHDTGTARRYLTIDHWTSASAYETFRDRHRQEYEDLDKRFANFTESEKFIGRFTIEE